MSRLTSLTADLAGTAQDLSKTFAYSPASQIVTQSLGNTAYVWSGPSPAGSNACTLPDEPMQGASFASYSGGPLGAFASIAMTPAAPRLSSHQTWRHA